MSVSGMLTLALQQLVHAADVWALCCRFCAEPGSDASVLRIQRCLCCLQMGLQSAFPTETWIAFGPAKTVGLALYHLSRMSTCVRSF